MAFALSFVIIHLSYFDYKVVFDRHWKELHFGTSGY